MRIKNRSWAWIAALGTISTSATFLARTSAQSSEVERVPLVRLLTAPENYDGHRVRVIGFVRLEFEGNVVYLHREDYQNAILGNGLWINVPRTLSPQDRKSLNMKYCIIEGTFDADNHGHMGLWSGALKNISRFEMWSDPAKPRH